MVTVNMARLVKLPGPVTGPGNQDPRGDDRKIPVRILK